MVQKMGEERGRTGYESVSYVHSRVTVYHPVLVDLRWSRAIHSCNTCPFRNQQAALQCKAVHYGMCTAVRLAKAPQSRPKSRHQQTINFMNQAVKEGIALRPTTTSCAVTDQQDTSKETKPTESGDSFLQRKEAELKKKREIEQRPKEVVDKDKKPNASQTSDIAAKKTDSAPAATSVVNDNKLKSITKSESSPAVIDSKNQRLVKQPSVDSSVHIPKFYFPQGLPCPPDDQDAVVQRIREEINKVDGGRIERQHMDKIIKACGRPTCWKNALYTYAAAGDKASHIQLPAFLTAWKKLTSSCYDEAAQFLRLLAKPGKHYLIDEDLRPLVQDVVDTHPGLSFLQDAPEFHSRYVQTVISRIFYTVNRSWSGRITATELRKSNFLQTLHLLDEEEDINQVMDYFSYEHFYVIYCKFWELDKDHDLYISKDDLAKHNDHAISSRMVDRIFSGCVTRQLMDGKMSYRDFVWFLVSEEDKRNATSIEYWFRCMDLDGDGVISMYEMEYFYEEQIQKMEYLGIETLPFMDCLCQMLDMVKPRQKGRITLMDLKSCQMTPVFFDTFFNLDKYLEHEQKDPFASVRDGDEEGEMTDWERYAAEEYEILVAEEGANDVQNDEIAYEDDFEADDDDDDDRLVSSQ